MQLSAARDARSGSSQDLRSETCVSQAAHDAFSDRHASKRAQASALDGKVQRTARSNGVAPSGEPSQRRWIVTKLADCAADRSSTVRPSESAAMLATPMHGIEGASNDGASRRCDAMRTKRAALDPATSNRDRRKEADGPRRDAAITESKPHDLIRPSGAVEAAVRPQQNR